LAIYDKIPRILRFALAAVSLTTTLDAFGAIEN
jgi:hypothetical protein